MSPLRIRMYNVGFGDCFLLTFGTGEEVRHVLFDCGSISSGAGQVTAVAEDVVDSCRDGQGKARIELVVCTHRHRDHVGGFANARWKEVEVGEVWMPWTEDPDDPDATRIRTRQSGFAASLATALGVSSDLLEQDPLTAAGSSRGEAATLQAVTLNALSNEKAMQTVHSGFAGNPPRHFLPLKGEACEARALETLSGVRFHILGPPRNEQALASMDPPKGGAYFNEAKPGSAEDPSAESEHAFRPKWRVDRPDFENDSPGSTFRRTDLKRIDELAEEPEGSLAAAIDRAINNTSLIILIEVEAQWLLFPGDAQWGAWNSALTNDQCRALMKRTTFYKVGHHGSENATPRIAVEDIFKDGLTSFFSTTSMKRWPNVPRGPLVEAIKTRGRIARSDDEAMSKKAGFDVKPGLYIEWTLDTAAG